MLIESCVVKLVQMLNVKCWQLDGRVASALALLLSAVAVKPRKPAY